MKNKFKIMFLKGQKRLNNNEKNIYRNIVKTIKLNILKKWINEFIKQSYL